MRALPTCSSPSRRAAGVDANDNQRVIYPLAPEKKEERVVHTCVYMYSTKDCSSECLCSLKKQQRRLLRVPLIFHVMNQTPHAAFNSVCVHTGMYYSYISRALSSAYIIGINS